MSERLTVKYLYLFFIIVGFLLFLVTHSKISLEPDSLGYLEISRSMLDGRYWALGHSALIGGGASAFRTPTYPVLLAIAQFCIAEPLRTTFLLHSLLGLCAIIAVFQLRTIRDRYSVLPISVALLISFYFVGESFQVVLCEWAGFIGMAILFTLIVQSARYPNSIVYQSATFILCLALVLLKPVFLVGCLPVIVYELFKMRCSRSIKLFSVTLFLIPLLGWMSFNYLRLGSFTIAPYGAFNLFGVASLIGNAEAKTEDLPVVRDFILEINNKKIPASGSEQAWIESLAEHGDLELFDYNMWEVAARFRQTRGLSWVTLNSIAGKYAARSLKAFPKNYFKYVWYGLSSSLITILIGLIVILVSFTRTSDSNALAVASAARLIAVSHLTLVVVTCLVHGALNRYWVMSEGAVLFAGITMLCCFLPVPDSSR